MTTAKALAFDVYGTLVDPISVRRRLEELLGEAAAGVAELWRVRQLEFTWRLTAMGRYLDFAEVTARSLDYALAVAGRPVSDAERAQLLAEYQRLAPYPDTVPGLRRLAAVGYRMAVFSNGTPRMLDTLLATTGLREFLPEVVSVDEVRVYKPAPEVYRHLADRLGRPPAEVRLVSANAFDVLGATNAGLRAAWCNRTRDVFDREALHRSGRACQRRWIPTVGGGLGNSADVWGRAPRTWARRRQRRRRRAAQAGWSATASRSLRASTTWQPYRPAIRSTRSPTSGARYSATGLANCARQPCPPRKARPHPATTPITASARS